MATPTFAEMDDELINNARSAVESFCKAEFEGDRFDQRIKLIKFSPAREKKEWQRSWPESPWVVFWDWDRFYIVSSYKVVDVKLSGKRGIATVEYRRIAESKGKEKIISSYKEQDIIKIDLIYDGKQWWVFDPPLPRISLKAIVDIYKVFEDDLLHLEKGWFEKATPEQRAIVTRKMESIKILKSLQNEIER